MLIDHIDVIVEKYPNMTLTLSKWRLWTRNGVRDIVIKRLLEAYAGMRIWYITRDLIRGDKPLLVFEEPYEAARKTMD